MNEQEPTSIWNSLPVLPGEFSLQQLRRDASIFRNMIVRRNLLEYAAGAIMIAAFGYVAWALPANIIMRTGCALLVLGTVVVMVQLHRQRSIGALPSSELALPYAAYLRHQLMRQRDALRSVSRWYIGPIVPGSIVFMLGTQPSPTDFPWIAASIFFLVMVAVTTTSHDAASELQQKIDQLDRAEF